MQGLILAIAVLLAVENADVTDDPAKFEVGKKVLPRPNAVVTMGNKTIDTDRFTVPWVIQDRDGEQLLVGDRSKGWVEQSQVVALADAPAYYAQFINSKQHKNDQHKAWAFYFRAAALLERGEVDAAIADYTDSLRLDSQRAAAYVARGIAWERKRDYDRTIADFKEAIRLDPTYSLTDNWLARAYEERGRARANKNDLDQAIADFSEAIRLDPTRTGPYNYRGWIWTKKKDYDHAMADFNQALRINSADCSALNNAAWLKATCPEERIRNGREAIDLATQANSYLGGEYFAWLDTLAAAYAEAGDFDNAIAVQRKAIAMNSDDKEFVAGAKQRLALYREHKPYREE